MKRLAISCGLAALLSVPGVHAASEVPDASRRLPAPEHVSPETRAELNARMSQHGTTMSNLVRSVVLLDRPTIRTLASRIADEELIAGAGKANQERKRLALPREFFTEQSALTVVARELATAAVDGSDDLALADRFSTLTRTCVGCHSVYLHGRPEPGPLGPRSK
jgi:hypothetical protein